ncbi:PIG-L family deacetylase [Aquabacterium sp. A7-Y]|uniref:PIG-L deacetylase family protein n=1 Tax=Aquabacterium sp. A7-Y TaxID=1349605 RepID=UPI00223E1887|nr:PIG-L family deacetylase [Aquabacterium sp. A7-Y]MCW7538472.1 PIG-L family deacetylase [Aquabacterium sp. A7-Y]
MPALPALEHLLVVSPHLDDGVFSCGQLLAAHPGSTVLTVFAGAPADEALRTEWDQRCGFANSCEAVAARHQEDREALAVLGARPVWLSFLDSQYLATPDPEEIASALLACLDALPCDAVVVPMGLFHSDHTLVHEACMAAAQARPERLWLAYEDALYRRMPGLLQQRLLALAKAGICATPAFPGVPGALADKQRAVMAYASQLRAFGPHGYADVLAEEHYWHLAPSDARSIRPRPQRATASTARARVADRAL